MSNNILGYMDETGSFIRVQDEHYFFTDASEFIWTHFPYDEEDGHYDR